ncbi:hypothetical protein [Magnetospirillum sulfuroxidans]|uniref:Uncharacterized protein n=1 Tax=Magnetospirillum sulfuroxidans TaxID=611300 RepID=A0ABS5IEK1_9PROT|nr:hypothetical protein [Magnetospirillum sulfuroxidans]MBR9972153.1 hypothetical protein [Magnetospirillum sulfuroxidans]
MAALLPRAKLRYTDTMTNRQTSLSLWILPLAFAALLAARPPSWLGVYPLVGVALFLLGRAFHRISGSLPAFLAQAAPFLSLIALQFPLPPLPEPLLIVATALVLAVALAAAQADMPRDRHGVLVGIIIGLSLWVTPSAAVLGLLPILLLDRRRLLVAGSIAAFIAVLMVSAPPLFPAEEGQFLSSAVHQSYSQALLRILFSRIIFTLALIATLVVLVGYFRMRRRGLLAANALARLAAGMILAQIAALFLAAGQAYPHGLTLALLLTGPTLAASWHITAQASTPHGHQRAWRWLALALVTATAPALWLQVAELTR